MYKTMEEVNARKKKKIDKHNCKWLMYDLVCNYWKNFLCYVLNA